MPFKSKQQWKFFFANPDIPMSKAKEWAHETKEKKEYKDLPKKVKKKKSKKKKTASEVLDFITDLMYKIT